MIKSQKRGVKMIERFNYNIPETASEMEKIKEMANKYINEKIK